MTQAQALEILKTGKNAFITGPAGSGKTHLVNSYIKYLRDNEIDVGVTASTGIAATHMGGMTIHSWAGIGIEASLTQNDIMGLAEKAYLRRRFEKVKVLIIDEVSMLHHYRFDLVNEVMKAMKGNELPFGGVQVVLCGDFFQLPPVSRPGEPESRFIYHSESWAEAKFFICYLSEQHRHKDGEVLSILSEIRRNDVSDGSRELLQSRHGKRTSKIEPTRLFTHNVDVDSLNEREFDLLESMGFTEYRMESKGRERLVAVLKKSCLAPEVLRLKKGARVMCVKNNFDEGYVNGTLGIVESCVTGEDPVIRAADGRMIRIEKATWTIEEDGKELALIEQYPLRLAWAITVHKSQGMSLDAVEVDLSKSFEPGMGYVALSRVRTLDGLTILGMNETALSVHYEVFERDADLQKLSEEAEVWLEELAEDRPAELRKLQEDFVAKNKPSPKEKKLSTYEETLALIEAKKSVAEMAKEREMTPETIVAHIEKLLELEAQMDISYLKREVSPLHWKKIEKAIEELSGESDELLLSPIKSKVGANVSFLHIRLARAILGFAPKSKAE
ncbi:MAG: AAA family ATPase [Candidatus Taylorbacteria bacterium]|nr:AAA family ATPase [Candidatus Taylorbacteria bacterium]